MVLWLVQYLHTTNIHNKTIYAKSCLNTFDSNVSVSKPDFNVPSNWACGSSPIEVELHCHSSEYKEVESKFQSSCLKQTEYRTYITEKIRVKRVGNYS